MKRRSILAAMAAAPLLAAAPSVATASTGRTTICLSPHQDDGVIRLSHYGVIAADRGDRIVLAQATDGAATAVGRNLRMTPKQTSTWRYREQTSAWSWLTEGRGEIVRIGEPDGAASADRIYAGLRNIVASAGSDVECYVATYPPDRPETVPADLHPDHLACVAAAERLAADGVVVRYAIHPTAKRGGTAYRARTLHQELRVQAAVDAYRVIGRRSTRSLDLVVGGKTRVRS